MLSGELVNDSLDVHPCRPWHHKRCGVPPSVPAASVSPHRHARRLRTSGMELEAKSTGPPPPRRSSSACRHCKMLPGRGNGSMVQEVRKKGFANRVGTKNILQIFIKQVSALMISELRIWNKSGRLPSRANSLTRLNKTWRMDMDSGPNPTSLLTS